jgi:SAM-dependent methyltransferase
MAESFGADPERYDRTRPRYPDALISSVLTAAPGPTVLDVGTGTGIVARQFRAAGCQVLGVDVDPRMAEFARRSGLEVEVAAFEQWDAAGRTFDAVVAGQTWHWIDPVAGAAKAAEILRPGGLLAVFWHVFQPPPEVAAAFSAVYRSIFAGYDPYAKPLLDAYAKGLTMATDGMRAAGAFAEPEKRRFDWERSYTREEWLEQLRTGGDTARFAPEQLDQVLSGIGSAIDGLGGSFRVDFITLALTAVRTRAD